MYGHQAEHAGLADTALAVAVASDHPRHCLTELALQIASLSQADHLGRREGGREGEGRREEGGREGRRKGRERRQLTLCLGTLQVVNTQQQLSLIL